MDDIIGLSSQNGNSKVIYSQFAGEIECYQNLALVSKRRLAAMYKIYLDYLEGELKKIDRDVVSQPS